MDNHAAKHNIKTVEGLQWHRGVVVITTAQLHSTVRGVSEIHDGEDL